VDGVPGVEVASGDERGCLTWWSPLSGQVFWLQSRPLIETASLVCVNTAGSCSPWLVQRSDGRLSVDYEKHGLS
jgi:hypothetical protein